MKLRFKTSHLIIGILSLIAIALSVAIGIKYYDLKKIEIPNVVLGPTPIPLSSEDTEKLLNTPSSNATDQERREYFTLVQKHAKTPAFLDISGCKGNPVVMTVRIDEPVQIRNNDESDHELTLSREIRYNIPAKSSETYKLGFEKGPGVYGFGCDKAGRAVGIFFVKG